MPGGNSKGSPYTCPYPSFSPHSVQKAPDATLVPHLGHTGVSGATTVTAGAPGSGGGTIGSAEGGGAEDVDGTGGGAEAATGPGAAIGGGTGGTVAAPGCG